MDIFTILLILALIVGLFSSIGRGLLGVLFSIIGWILYIGGPITAIILIFGFVFNNFSFGQFIISIILFPITLICIPFYSFFNFGDLNLMFWAFGSPILGIIVQIIGNFLRGKIMYT